MLIVMRMSSSTGGSGRIIITTTTTTRDGDREVGVLEEPSDRRRSGGLRCEVLA